ncbi:DUF6660 family protein [Dawidia soli]|uniref:DUF6660 family protein n=1 Tax=Dawidia soli TaxID=2782352 RepID=UPI003742D693
MRIVYLIFTFYLAALSVYPCYDDDCCGRDEIACSEEHDQDDDDAQTPCTPFCASRCCTFHISFPVKPAIYTLSATSELNDAYRPSTAPTVALPIWQPPKV